MQYEDNLHSHALCEQYWFHMDVDWRLLFVIIDDAGLMNCGVLGDANLEELLITTMTLSAVVVIIVIVIICIAAVFLRSDGKVFFECGVYHQSSNTIFWSHLFISP